MGDWSASLRYLPLPPLLASEDEALEYYTRGELLGEAVGPVDRLWELPAAKKILAKQLADGSWPRHGEKKHPAINYKVIETWRNLRVLVGQFGFSREHPQMAKAAEYLFSCQSQAGDIRGILANQYATYYTGSILALLIQAGYEEDPRIEKGLQWLLSMRQYGGGWTIPLLTHQFDGKTIYRLTSQYAEPVEPLRSMPFSHNWTGMVLRAFAAHTQYRKSQAARIAAGLLKSRFFQPDAYSSYQAESYWVRFEYPFWWNNLVAALDSISLIGLPKDDEQISLALRWLADHQETSGMWKVSYARPEGEKKASSKERSMQPWVSLAICRVFKRFHQAG